MANSTVRGALSIHGGNPQVRLRLRLLFPRVTLALALLCGGRSLELILSVPHRESHPSEDIRVPLLERTLLRPEWYVSINSATSRRAVLVLIRRSGEHHRQSHRTQGDWGRP
jgi:hypothetical protein